MAMLPNFPLVNQRTTVTGDGRPSENALFDCVAACIDAMCRYFLHTPENSVFNPDHFKDEAYGENWRNDGTDAARYVDFCKSLGINLHSIAGNSPELTIAVARDCLSKGLPVIFTELDPYVDTSLPQYQGWTHAVVCFADDANGLTALDPFIGKPIYKTNAAWMSVLRSNVLWIAEKIGEHSMIPQNWKDQNGVLISPASVQGGEPQHITGKFREYILSNPWPSANVALNVGHHVDQLELNNPDLGSGWVQDFRFARLEMPDNGPQAGKVIYGWNGVELLHLQQLYAAAQAQLAQVHDPNLVANRLQAIELEAQKIAQLATQPI